MSNIRSLFHDPNKIPPNLRHALALLRLQDLSDLEDRFLSTTAFLNPWSVFRDSISLHSPDALSRATLIQGAGEGISRLEILWFYTQFDEGTLRYDARADKYSRSYTPDASVYGTIDKSHWRVEEYEKHLYAWLLQEFKVGKAYSPWRFECFELKNICMAWEDVFVPIVNAVRASYDRRGRRYYGRLATFIEERCPSRLAFPEGNVEMTEGEVMSPTPYRVVSVPKTMINGVGGRSFSGTEKVDGVLSKKHYDETERELRDVYPQYGGLVERPKFKHKMEEWLSEQRTRAERRKRIEVKNGGVQGTHIKVLERNGSRSPTKQSKGSFRKNQQLQHQRTASGKDVGGGSPIKHFSDTIKRSLPHTVSSILTKEEPKSPLHGVTRQLHFLDSKNNGSGSMPSKITPLPRPDPNYRKPSEHDATKQLPYAEPPEAIGSCANVLTSSSTKVIPLPRPDQHYRKPSEMSVYTSIRNSNPFSEEEFPAHLRPPRVRANTADSVHSLQRLCARTDTDDSVLSPMVQLSAIPRPLSPESRYEDVGEEQERHVMRTRKSFHEARVPSYEGTAYQAEISLTDLHTQRLQATKSPESTRAGKLATRLPAPIVPIPYGGPRIASADKEVKGASYSPKKTERPVEMLPKPVEMPETIGVSPPKPSLPRSESPSKARGQQVAPTSNKRAAWSGTSPPKATAWPGFSSSEESLPPLPPKSPDRQPKSRMPNQLHNPRSRQLMREAANPEVSRIVSKENIRAALGGISRDGSSEDLLVGEPVRPPVPAVQIVSARPLRTYNSHLFPRKDERKGTPVGEWVKGKTRGERYEPPGPIEVEALEKR